MDPSLAQGGPACLAIRSCVGCALIIRLIIQTIGLYPTGAVWTDGPSNVSSRDPSGAVQADAEHPSRNRKVEGSNPSSGSICASEWLSSKSSRIQWIRRWQPERLADAAAASDRILTRLLPPCRRLDRYAGLALTPCTPYRYGQLIIVTSMTGRRRVQQGEPGRVLWGSQRS
jgi:hypothetical protein